jgi:hypothetical protein
VESGNKEINGLIDVLGEQKEVNCRISLHKAEDGWRLENMFVNAPAPSEPPAWSVYDYGNYAFINLNIEGDVIGQWLNANKGEARGYDFSIPTLQTNIHWNRYSSHIRNSGFYNLPQPYTLYQVHAGIHRNGERPSAFTPLVSRNCLSFPSYVAAVYHFLYDRPHASGRDIPGDLIVIRIAHPEAWIENITMLPHAVDIEIRGTQAGGTNLSIGSSTGVRVDEILDGEGVRRFDIHDAGKSQLWFVLARDERWLDSRETYERSPSSLWNNISFDTENLEEQMTELLDRGEDERLEYKLKVPDDDEKFLKTVAAFANGKGGIILIGVKDDGKVEGIRTEVAKYGDIRRYKDAIADSICNKLDPLPAFRIEHCEVEHRQVIAITVQEGVEKPYGLKTSPPSFFVRRAGTTREASTAEIRSLSRESIVETSYSPYLGDRSF